MPPAGTANRPDDSRRIPVSLTMEPKPAPQASDYVIVASPADPSGPAPRRGTLDVLVIEGEADQCELIARCLEARGRENIRIEFVHTVKDALRAVRGNKYNCVLVSHELPDGRGIDLLEELDDELLTTPVIGLASGTDTADAVEYIRAGRYRDRPAARG